MIQFQQVSKTYPNGVQALKNVSLKVDQGEICGDYRAIWRW